MDSTCPSPNKLLLPQAASKALSTIPMSAETARHAAAYQKLITDLQRLISDRPKYPANSAADYDARLSHDRKINNAHVQRGRVAQKIIGKAEHYARMQLMGRFRAACRVRFQAGEGVEGVDGMDGLVEEQQSGSDVFEDLMRDVRAYLIAVDPSGVLFATFAQRTDVYNDLGMLECETDAVLP